jgi:kynurenine 3-monooxygenase
MTTHPNLQNQQATIVGAGLGGVMMAIRLARRGYAVDVYERRPSVSQAHAAQRSFTVTLSKRGLVALNEIGLMEAALKLSSPISGRMVHNPDGTTTYVPYSKDNCEQLHAIRRTDINALLYSAAEKFPNIRFFFNQTLTLMDKATNTLWFQDQTKPQLVATEVQSPFILGCDGVFSAVRQQMQRGERTDYHQDFLDWGYKDVFIPAQANGQHAFRANALHLWPRGNCTFFAFPNTDGTFSGNFIAPFEFAEQLTTPEANTELLSREFADLLAVAPALPQHLAALPMSHFITMHTTQWHYKDRIVLLGDAAHAVTPFWGEGMNASFEDTSVLDTCLADSPDDRLAALVRFQNSRKPNTDLLAQLAKQNFIELRDTTSSLRVVARKTIERKLYQLFPDKWLPLNIMISHRAMSYTDAAVRYQKQQRLARHCGMDMLAFLFAVGPAAQRSLQKLARAVRHERHAQQMPVDKVMQ